MINQLMTDGTTKIRTQIEKNRRMIKMEKKGIVKFISPKTFGVILEGEDKIWYNLQKGLPVDLRLKGQKVVMELIDPHTFKSIELDRNQPKPIEIRDKDRSEVLIVREVSAKCAAEMASTQKEFLEIAEMIERWILR